MSEAAPLSFETLVSLCKRRGFVFPSSEIYGGMSGFWDYGPLGVEMKNNIKRLWWKSMVQERDDVVGIDAAIIMNPRVWEASGHVATFTDPMVDCKSCKHRFRTDQIILWEVVETPAIEPLFRVTTNGSDWTAASDKVVKRRGVTMQVKELGPISLLSSLDGIACPDCDAVGQFTEPRAFNLMFKTHVGPVEDSGNEAYLRPETAQAMFVNFDNVVTSMRRKLPFGIAQIGRSFRNEITPGNFIFRDREFEQMEMEYFCKPADYKQWHDHWLEQRLAWHHKLGVRPENLRIREHTQEELSHYSNGTYDIEYNFGSMGWSELEGIASRTDFDLKAHATASGKALTYFDEEANEHIVPFVIEPAVGVDRTFLTLLYDAYREEEVRGEKRVYLQLSPLVAPIKVAVLPLSRNEKLSPLAREVSALLRPHFFTQFDDAQSIGRRYRRQDEIGTPYCVTVDFDSLEDNAVTVRERDFMEQERIAVADLVPYLQEKLSAGAF